ncbi:protein indeterminate-domain 16-like [Andrographis paniculata]|uniref:protein indeterminate-domain 16-like n=1 Tax=Andrographis paniculata TaxID=175694 RepID=UPI0021E99447|nr:protein indeterminate-domain 16-like [Andrographis paniculata]
MDDRQDLKEMQLFSGTAPPSLPWRPESPTPPKFWPADPFDGGGRPSLDLDLQDLDLELSISVKPASDRLLIRRSLRKFGGGGGGDAKMEAPSAACVEALKWQAAEQIRLAAIEKAYAERVRELTRREMGLAQSEFARARHMWERAREEADRAERMKERAAACMEITCQSCRQKFRP